MKRVGERGAALSHPEELVELLTPYLVRRRYDAGQVLWIQGQHSGRLFVLEEGRVKSTRTGADGSETLVFLFGPGDVFGFLPFFDGGPYPGTAVVVEPSVMLTMTRSTLREVATREPRVAFAALTVIGKRLRSALQRIEELADVNASCRVCAALMRLLPESTRPEPVTIALPGPAASFARESGVAPETFSRVLTLLEKDGVVNRLGGGRLQILNLGLLLSRAERRDDSS